MSSSAASAYFIVIITQASPIPYAQPPPNHLPTSYGSYHQLYRLDGQLIAIGVLDILPSCVSSVYFIYDQTWEEFSLGKVAEPQLWVSTSTHYAYQLSALREVSLASEMHDAGAPQMGFLYMGEDLQLFLFGQVFNFDNQVSTFIPVGRCDIKENIRHLI
jgi:Arginine-tRNA-protein transferase, C terminus